MLLGFCLYTWFPYGGLQRDFLRIALECHKRGHGIRVYSIKWEGRQPDNFEVVLVPVKDYSRIRRNQKFVRWVQTDLEQRPVDHLVGFNRMPGLDAYYAADPCFMDRARTKRSIFYRLTPRCRHHLAFERAVFSPDANVEILLLSQRQKAIYQRYYNTPEERFHLLPPGIARDRRPPADKEVFRQALRKEFGFGQNDLLLLQIGSGFRVKGLDRTLNALAGLPQELLRKSRLLVIGEDDSGPFLAQAKNLAISDRVTILPGREDVPRFLFAADVLIHPAYSENTGTVLLEAVVAGLPVLVTDVCGYAHYISDADAGIVLASPFHQSVLSRELAAMLSNAEARARWSANGMAFAKTADIYSLPGRAADVILGEIQ